MVLVSPRPSVLGRVANISQILKKHQVSLLNIEMEENKITYPTALQKTLGEHQRL